MTSTASCPAAFDPELPTVRRPVPDPGDQPHAGWRHLLRHRPLCQSRQHLRAHCLHDDPRQPRGHREGPHLPEPIPTRKPTIWPARSDQHPQVRYWSLCTTLKGRHTGDCLRDEQISIPSGNDTFTAIVSPTCPVVGYVQLPTGRAGAAPKFSRLSQPPPEREPSSPLRSPGRTA